MHEKSVERWSSIVRHAGGRHFYSCFITMFTLESWEPGYPCKSYTHSLLAKCHSSTAAMTFPFLKGNANSLVWNHTCNSEQLWATTSKCRMKSTLPWDTVYHPELPSSLLGLGGHIQTQDLPLSRAVGPMPLSIYHAGSEPLIWYFLGNRCFIISLPVEKGKGFTVEIVEELF